MAVTIWGSSYKRMHCAGTQDGGAVSVALVANASTFDLKFKRSTDGTTWPSDGSAVTITTGLTSQQFFVEPARDGTGELKVTNSLDRVWRSRNMGQTWTAL